jgi:hypothetical protein
MDVFFVRDIFLIEVVEMDFLFAVGGAQELQEVALELVAVVADILF